MKSWIVAALSMTGVAAVLGFTGMAGSATAMARVLFAVLLVITLCLVGWAAQNRRTD